MKLSFDVKLATALITVLVVSFVGLYFLAPSDDHDEDVSTSDVREACNTGGSEIAAVISDWKASGRLRAAASVAAGFGWYACQDSLTQLVTVSDDAPIFGTPSYIPPLEQPLPPALLEP